MVGEYEDRERHGVTLPCGTDFFIEGPNKDGLYPQQLLAIAQLHRETCLSCHSNFRRTPADSPNQMIRMSQAEIEHVRKTGSFPKRLSQPPG